MIDECETFIGDEKPCNHRKAGLENPNHLWIPEGEMIQMQQAE
jgi:hypothetical protein